jgi:hypothetical protein
MVGRKEFWGVEEKKDSARAELDRMPRLGTWAAGSQAEDEEAGESG